MNIETSTLFWLFFYIEVTLLGIFLTLVYLVFNKKTRKSRTLSK